VKDLIRLPGTKLNLSVKQMQFVRNKTMFRRKKNSPMPLSQLEEYSTTTVVSIENYEAAV
jgi:hypothetical protein